MVVLGVHQAARQPSGWPGASWPQATPASQGFSRAAGWVTRATARHVVAATPGWDYGWAGRGFGGQLLLIIPSRNIFGPLLDALTADGQP